MTVAVIFMAAHLLLYDLRIAIANSKKIIDYASRKQNATAPKVEKIF